MFDIRPYFISIKNQTFYLCSKDIRFGLEISTFRSECREWDVAGFNLITRAGQVDLVIGTSSSGDDSRTLTVPFGSFYSSGLPEAIKLSIQAANGISIPQADVA